MPKIGKKSLILAAVLAAAAFAGGYFLGARGHERPAGAATAHEHGPQAETWTCSMHPQIRQPGPGKCPLCAMDLIPVAEDAGEQLGPRELKLSEAAQRLAEIQVAPVERHWVTKEVRMVGKVDFDETRLATITAWTPGRLDRLYVNYTGVPVKKGDHLVYVYSPEILTAQQELLQALETEKRLAGSSAAVIRETARATVEATRERLRLWGLTPEQVRAVETGGRPSDHVTIYAPIGGIVVHKDAVEGMYVQTGTRIYTIADLSHLWVKLDAYESDLVWLRYGQEVQFMTEAYPGDPFKGRITFIDPVLNNATRTVKIRVNVANPDGKLKPGMFVRAVVSSRIAAGGNVIDDALAGKWISPMHPEVVKDGPGTCDVCGMPLIKAESLGYVSASAANAGPPLVVPASAPLITGRRAVVYVKAPGRPGVFEGREVVLGPRAGDYYLVKHGLAEDELVVVNGNFKIDSALQILAKPSMMSADGQAPPAHHGGPGEGEAPAPAEAAPVLPPAFASKLEALLDAYFSLQGHLSHDRFEPVKGAAEQLLARLGEAPAEHLPEEARAAWGKAAAEVRTSAQALAESQDIEAARKAFALLSDSLISAAKRFGAGLRRQVIRMQCPMAFNNRGASWLQSHAEVENPYFGDAMFRCGGAVETLSKGGEAPGP